MSLLYCDSAVRNLTEKIVYHSKNVIAKDIEHARTRKGIQKILSQVLLRVEK